MNETFKDHITQPEITPFSDEARQSWVSYKHLKPDATWEEIKKRIEEDQVAADIMDELEFADVLAAESRALNQGLPVSQVDYDSKPY